MRSPDKYYISVADIVSKNEFEKMVREKIERSGGLLNPETAARLLAAEFGRNEIRINSIASLKNGENSIVEGYVDDVGSLKKFTTKNGRGGKVMHLRISDDAGVCRLVLWNRDTALAEKIEKGMKIRIINGKVKNSEYGTELSLSKWSSVWVEVEGEMLQIR